jgi:hypothetical protein
VTSETDGNYAVEAALLLVMSTEVEHVLLLILRDSSRLRDKATAWRATGRNDKKVRVRMRASTTNYCESGKRIVKVEPPPGVLSTLIDPLWSSTTFFVM